MLTYTNRFLALAALVRNLHGNYKQSPSQIILCQIADLRTRIHLIRDMQGLGVMSLLLCVFCTYLLFEDCLQAGKVLFGTSLLLLMFSLFLSILEIRLSVKALDLHLSVIEHDREE